jgi:hypothetical protein
MKNKKTFKCWTSNFCLFTSWITVQWHSHWTLHRGVTTRAEGLCSYRTRRAQGAILEPILQNKDRVFARVFIWTWNLAVATLRIWFLIRKVNTQANTRTCVHISQPDAPNSRHITCRLRIHSVICKHQAISNATFHAFTFVGIRLAVCPTCCKSGTLVAMFRRTI